VKSGGEFTIKVTGEVCVRFPLTPWIVSVEVPTGVLPVVVTVNVE
jgi:hypothetical protein